ncbi:MAG: outer membrane beta-barrel protein [Bacteroidota bacterium]|nr:outer membrane beta-barrel protein [Bacteroidota bacterium]MDP4204850.1 outer membrane beta-barrel protein [Bacteroidota bacterium]
MKKIVLAIALAIVSVSVFAESPLNLGLKFGLNNSRLSTNLSDYKQENINNYLAGAFARVNVGRFYLQPEVYYNSKGGDLMDKALMDKINSFDFKTVDVPVLAGIKLYNTSSFNIRAMGGPVMSFVTEKSIETKDLTIDNFKNHFFGWQYGAGVDFLFLTFDVRVEKSSGITTSSQVSPSTKCYLLSLGMKLF